MPSAFINRGGNRLVGGEVGTWYSAQVSGALLDVQSAVVLGLAVALLVRAPRRLFAVPAALMIAGWSSNVLDRLGLHFWTAPGSVRGAVDFIHLDGCAYNVADVAIVAGTLGFGVVLGAELVTGRLGARLAASRGVGGRHRPAGGGGSRHRRPHRGRLTALGAAAAATGLVAAVAFGAVHDTGITRPPDLAGDHVLRVDHGVP